MRDFVDPCQIVAFDVHVLANRLKFCSDAFLPALGTPIAIDSYQPIVLSVTVVLANVSCGLTDVKTRQVSREMQHDQCLQASTLSYLLRSRSGVRCGDGGCTRGGGRAS